MPRENSVTLTKEIAMTFANQITVLRILLIPVFVLCAIYYGASVKAESPVEAWRWSAVGVFIFASITDALDGAIARRFGQTTRSGAILDPLADKGLLLTAIITLSVSDWRIALPLWFPVLVIARDAVIVTGCIVIRLLYNELDVRPSWLGKVATALQMIAVSWVMLQLPYIEVPVMLAGVFTLVSGIELVWRGTMKLTHHEKHS